MAAWDVWEAARRPGAAAADGQKLDLDALARFEAPLREAGEAREELLDALQQLHHLSMTAGHPDGERVPVRERLGEPMKRAERAQTHLESIRRLLAEVSDWLRAEREIAAAQAARRSAEARTETETQTTQTLKGASNP